MAAFVTVCLQCCALQSLIKYISELGIPGAVLIFLPGWNIIFMLGRHLGQHPVIGEVHTHTHMHIIVFGTQSYVTAVQVVGRGPM